MVEEEKKRRKVTSLGGGTFRDEGTGEAFARISGQKGDKPLTERQQKIAAFAPTGPQTFQLGDRQVSKEEFQKERTEEELHEQGGKKPVTEEEKVQLEKTFQEQGVFKDVEQEPIISPEQENLGVMARILSSVLPSDVAKIGPFDIKPVLDKLGKNEVIPQAEITMIEADLEQGITEQVNVVFEEQIQQADGTIIEIGLLPPEYLPPVQEQVGVAGVATGVGATLAGGAVIGPIKEFVGTDGQIANLEKALSQYNEAITIPARSLANGLPPMQAFEQYNRIEESILALEQQLQISSLTSQKVSIALKGRAVEARLIKLKNKLQEGRGIIARQMSAETFSEVNVPGSISFLRGLYEKKR